MISSHITNKEAMKQNMLYPIEYSVITMLNGYMIHKKSLCVIHQYDNIIHSSYEVVSLLPVLSEKHICILFSVK